jgi:hypothetical protein
LNEAGRSGPDGALWFLGARSLGRVTIEGKITEYEAPMANGDLFSISPARMARCGSERSVATRSCARPTAAVSNGRHSMAGVHRSQVQMADSVAFVAAEVVHNHQHLATAIALRYGGRNPPRKGAKAFDCAWPRCPARRQSERAMSVRAGALMRPMPIGGPQRALRDRKRLGMYHDVVCLRLEYAVL